MANFFEAQRTRLDLSLTEVAARMGVTAESPRTWEAEKNYPTRVPVATLAKAYEVTEERMADEVMALRMRIEKRDAKLATSGK